MAEQTAVFGIYSDRTSTAHAIDSLKTAGFQNADIITVFPDEIGAWQFSTTDRTRLREGAIAGGVLGLLISGLLLWIMTAASLISFGVIAIFITLVSAGVIGSLAGGIAGRRISAYEQRYESRVRRGAILVSVTCADAESTARAKEILLGRGGDDVSVSDKMTVDFVRTNRILVRPASEKTRTPVLRLVSHENLERDSSELRRGVKGNVGSARRNKRS